MSSAVAAQLASIQAVAALDLPRAHALAEQLDATTTTANGEMHVDTLRVREVRAYLVHLTGHHDTAVAWYLHVVRLHAGLHGANHEETALAVRRAYSMWKSLPNLDAVRLADDLINAFAEVPSAGTEAVRRMREHMRSSHQTAGGGGQECAATPAG
ncbi:hypothetical protein AB0N28_07120 [Streptomyces sp. NPDC051130]|uniref:hypothetical protein n=1 Tax=Streptomyces sp. NPDC051130 TaxID=3157223 RepID=UPI003418903E